MIRVDGILFDLDGTLIDSKRDLVLCLQHLQRRSAHPVSPDEAISNFIGDGVERLVERALPGIRGKKLDQAVTQFKRYYQRHCLDHTRSYAGVRGMLTRWRQKKLAVVTNKPERISRQILARLGLLSRFAVVVGGDTVPERKPHPAPLVHAMRLMDLSPQKTLMVGDGPNDVRAGRAAGTWTGGIFSAIGRPEKLKRTHPDFLMHHFSELPKHIR